MLRGACAGAVLSVLMCAPAGAQERVPFVIVSAPGSGNTTYLPPVAVTRAGHDLRYVNADPALHDVVALGHYAPVQCPDEPGLCPEGAPFWCLPPDPASAWDDVANFLPYRPGECPLFYSELIGVAGSTPVWGTEYLEAGETYMFECSIHPWMTGTLYVLPEPGP